MSSVSKKSKTIKKKRSSRKKTKDPNAPKRPRSAYILYSQDAREEAKKMNPTAKPAELMQIMGKMWKELTETEKKPFLDRAVEDKGRFTDEMKDYQPPEEDDDEEEDEDEDDDDDDEDGGKKKKKKSTKSKKKKKDPNAPKKGMSAYLHYGQSVREKVKGEHQSARSADLMQIIGKMWKELTEDQKQPFFELAKRDRERYEVDKANYIASGGGAASAPTKKPKPKPPKVKEPEPEEEEDDDDNDDGGDDDDDDDDDDDEE